MSEAFRTNLLAQLELELQIARAMPDSDVACGMQVMARRMIRVVSEADIPAFSGVVTYMRRPSKPVFEFDTEGSD